MQKQMSCSLPTGTLILQWPADITVEWVEFAEELIALQLRSVKRRAVAAEPKARTITHAYELETE